MELFDRPLIAFDGSADSEAALDAVLALRPPDTPGMRLHLVTVVERATLLARCAPAGMGIAGISSVVTAAEREARAALERAADRALDAGVPADYAVVDGPVADELLREARACGASCIALGTHGRSGVVRALLGSVSERVVRRSEFPVLSVRAGRVPQAVGRVLCALDESPASHEAARIAIGYARRRGAPLTFVTIVAIDDTIAEGFERDRVDPGGTIAKLYEDAATQLAPFVEEAATYGIEATTRVAGASDVANAILAVAAEGGAGLIALGTHGRRGLERVVTGSTAERILRTAVVPVVAVRDPALRAPSGATPGHADRRA